MAEIELERQQEPAKLRIYIGAAPGVGKTYHMLNDALPDDAPAGRGRGDWPGGDARAQGDRGDQIRDLEIIPLARDSLSRRRI